MDTVIPDKAYFRIGEVSKILEVEPYVVRYWETEFKTVRPVRTRTSQRLYRKKDVEALLLIRDLLYRQRFTIDGAKRQIEKLRDKDDLTVNPAEDRLVQVKKELLKIRDIIRGN